MSNVSFALKIVDSVVLNDMLIHFLLSCPYCSLYLSIVTVEVVLLWHYCSA